MINQLEWLEFVKAAWFAFASLLLVLPAPKCTKRRVGRIIWVLFLRLPYIFKEAISPAIPLTSPGDSRHTKPLPGRHHDHQAGCPITLINTCMSRILITTHTRGTIKIAGFPCPKYFTSTSHTILTFSAWFFNASLFFCFSGVSKSWNWWKYCKVSGWAWNILEKNTEKYIEKVYWVQLFGKPWGDLLI